jgi:hypothetical protein
MECRNLHYLITKKLEKHNTGRFNKGHVSWNNGVKGLHLSFETEFKKIGYTFKGTKKEYLALHYWVRKIFGTPNECVFCGEPKFGKNISWANVSHTYTKDLNDWIPLCVRCHFYYDRKERLII